MPSLSPRQLATQEKSLKTDAVLPDLKHAHEIADVVDGRSNYTLAPTVKLPRPRMTTMEQMEKLKRTRMRQR